MARLANLNWNVSVSGILTYVRSNNESREYVPYWYILFLTPFTKKTVMPTTQSSSNLILP